MDNYDFIERRIRFLRWVFSKEEPWRKYKKLGSSLVTLFNHELTVDLEKLIAKNSYIYPTANYPYPPNTIQTLLQLITTVNSSAITTVNSSASASGSITYFQV